MEDKIHLREHLALTPFEPGDKPNLIRYLNDPLIASNTLNIPAPYTEADADWWLDHVREEREQSGQNLNWAIRHSEYGTIGGIGCFLRTGLEGHSDEIGYWLAAPFRGQGIMTTAVEVFSAWLFSNRPALVRIEARVYVHNPASARVLEKAGFEREGILRKATKKKDQLIDVILLSKIRPGI
jgi:ribosomal-protein-alanine N-acetyltransferase